VSMEAAWIARARWRWRGAWLWPTFVVGALLDGGIATTRPFIGDRQSFAGGMLGGLVLNLLAVLFLSRGFGRLVRRWRTDMPLDVARNYGGTAAVVLVSAGLLAIGMARHEGIVDAQHALRDAVVRAVAYIGDHAPPTFRVNARRTDTFTIQAGAIYRTCVPSRDGRHVYCVIVKPRLPPRGRVVFAGYEPNWLFAEGVN
jgi:hypothetical protein